MLTRLFVLLLGPLLLYLIGLVVYRLYFHPFAKYPGPFFAKISYFYAFYYAWNEDTLVAQSRCHSKYGHVVRYNPDSLIFDEPAAIREIYGYGRNFWKGKAYTTMMTNPHGKLNLAQTADKQEHARRRRIISQAFSTRAVRESQPYIKSHIDTLCDILAALPQDSGSKWTEPLNFEDLLGCMTQDINTDLIFGRSYNLLTDPTYRHVNRLSLSSLRRLQLIYQYPGLFKPGLNKWLDFGTWFLPQADTARRDFFKLGVQSTMQRINAPPDETAERKDILSYLIAARDEETGTTIDKEEIIVEASMLMLAGGTSTVMSLTGIFFYLSRTANRKVLERLTHELRTTYTNLSDITIDETLDRCAYLHATVTETLRFTAASALWREAGHDGATITIPNDHTDDSKGSKTHYIPTGYVAASFRFALHRDPQIYPDPHTFDPSRFLPDLTFYTTRGFTPDQASAALDRAKSACRPFSSGPRSCIAERLATIELNLTVASVIWSFDIRQAPGEIGELGGGGKPGMRPEWFLKDEFQLFGAFTTRGAGPVVQFRKRSEVE